MKYEIHPHFRPLMGSKQWPHRHDKLKKNCFMMTLK